MFFVFVPGGFSARDYGIVAVCSLLFVCCLSVATMGRFTPIFLKFCQWIPSGLISYGLKRHYDPSIFRHIFMQYCSSVNILYKGNLGSFTPISLKFCQSTSYGLVSYGFKRHYDPSIYSHIFM